MAKRRLRRVGNTAALRAVLGALEVSQLELSIRCGTEPTRISKAMRGEEGFPATFPTVIAELISQRLLSDPIRKEKGSHAGAPRTSKERMHEDSSPASEV
jgi:hypothetical protein